MYQPVIGLEIHLQLKTKTKLFSRASAEYFSASPNTHVTEVDFGLPGALPMINKLAFEKCLKLALALNCNINKETKFDRKNYFYPDLAKGYQISQFDKPIGFDGYVEIDVKDDSRRIRIRRVHLEEDTAKSIHTDSGETLIDYNKSGVPLAEIVTEPDFQTVEEVLAFAKRLRQIVRYIDASDAEMQKGQMRFELNISVREANQKELPDYKVEVKNIGSISVLEKVINFEIKRQSELLEKGEAIKNQTRGLKDMTGETLFQRAKESSDDYRYFPEPDIPPITISDEWISDLQSRMPELPAARKNRYLGLGLDQQQAEAFIEDRNRSKFYDECIEEVRNSKFEIQTFAKDLSNWINTEIVGQLEKRDLEFSENKLKPSDLLHIIQMINDKKITGTIGKAVVEEIFNSGKGAEEIIKEKDLVQVEDESFILNIVDEVIKNNHKVVSDISKNPNAIKFLVGQVMKLSKGKINPRVAEEKLQERLKS